MDGKKLKQTWGRLHGALPENNLKPAIYLSPKNLVNFAKFQVLRCLFLNILC